jgi:enediyne biosynthesis protein E7
VRLFFFESVGRVITIDANFSEVGSRLRDDPCGALYKLASAHPGETLRLKLGSQTIFIFQDSGAAEHVLRTRPENYRKNFGPFVSFFGSSRLTEDGERWRSLQKLSQPFIAAIDKSLIATCTNVAFSKAVTSLVSGIDHDGAAQIDCHLDKAAAAVISAAVLGFDMKDLGETAFEDFRVILRHGAATAWNLPGVQLQVDSELRKSAKSAIKHLGNAVERLVTERRQIPGTTGVLSSLVAATPGKVDLLGEICTLLFAGFDTSAAALAWALWLLAQMPVVQKDLRGQIEKVVGQTEPHPDHLGRLPDLMAFVNETLRVFPPIPMLSRVAAERDIINGIHIQPGQRILLSVIGIHLNGDYFADPIKCIPSRFPEGKPTHDQREHFMPFGFGPRACGGARFAMVELPLALMTLLRKLQFGRIERDELKFEWGASMRRRGGHRLKVQYAE